MPHGLRNLALLSMPRRKPLQRTLIPPRESSEGEKGEPVTEPPPVEEEKEGWSSSPEGWETSDDGDDDGKVGKEDRDKKGKKGKGKGKQVMTCWMFWECCECGANNAPARGKCRECGRVKCDLCYRRLPRKVAVVGDFM
ncbi:hypothetical protein B9Z19DRAFT_1131958 [Tuber borchii]|uniref:RanBP2-type domain-containing protein n=1 Tax=Tuber borchii TaxID=42251 RepID=A0A2T6ZHU6_TUBBO|nr:hypothetical protein B9Z19DRAFT_1131958 [Tuber borchii]